MCKNFKIYDVHQVVVFISKKAILWMAELEMKLKSLKIQEFFL